MKKLKEYIDAEITQAVQLADAGDLEKAFHHLERAHVMGQSSTVEHTRVHILMLKLGLKKKNKREVAGQLFRIVGAATKTPLGLYPIGNTGGANVSPFKSMPLPDDLKQILSNTK